jgi:hypothetical protein
MLAGKVHAVKREAANAVNFVLYKVGSNHRLRRSLAGQPHLASQPAVAVTVMERRQLAAAASVWERR